MQKSKLLALCLLSVPALASAASRQLGLQEAMELARLQAHGVAAAHSRITAGDERLRQAKSYRLPTIRVQEVFVHTNSPADVFGLQLNQKRFSFGDFVAGDPNNPEALDNFLTRFELEMPLYAGGELSRRIEQARLAGDSSEVSASWAEDSAALTAAESYIMLSQVREQVRLLERSLETVTAHVEIAQAYTDQGMLVRSELLRAQVERSRIEDMLSEARGHAKVAEANLSFRLAMDTSTSWDLEAIPDPTPLDEPLESWLATAAARSDLEAARRMLEAGQLEARVQKSGLYPKIGLVARYDLNDDQLFGTNGDASSVMAMASIDLFSGGRHRAAAAAAQAEAEAGAQEIRQFQESIKLEVKNAYERAVSARERHATAQDGQAAAAEAERITEQRFRKGVVKMIDLLDTTTALREAETRELVALAEAHLASFRLAVKSGRAPETVLAGPSIDPPQSSDQP